MLSDLDNMALEFAKAFNEVHRNGVTKSGEQGGDFLILLAVKLNLPRARRARSKWLTA